MNIKTAELFGYLGLLILTGVLIYLLLKLGGVIHSSPLEELLLATVVGQLFYSGYTHRAIKEFEKRLGRIEKRLKI